MPRFLERSRRVKDFRHETKPITGNNFSRSRFSRTESSISRCCSYDKRRRLFFSTFHKFARSNCDKPWQAFAIITSGSRRRIFHGSRIACLIFHSQMRSKKRRRQKKKKKEGRKRTRNIGKKRKRAGNAEKKKSTPQRKKKAIHDATRFFNLVRRSVRICDRCSHRYLHAYRVSVLCFLIFRSWG